MPLKALKREEQADGDMWRLSGHIQPQHRRYQCSSRRESTSQFLDWAQAQVLIMQFYKENQITYFPEIENILNQWPLEASSLSLSPSSQCLRTFALCDSRQLHTHWSICFPLPVTPDGDKASNILPFQPVTKLRPSGWTKTAQSTSQYEKPGSQLRGPMLWSHPTLIPRCNTLRIGGEIVNRAVTTFV